MRFLIGLGLFLCSISFAYAQSDTTEFTIRVFGGTDTATPTAPILLTANPISPTQVDLSWSSSTDNYAVRGYVISRGSTTIATTSQLSFSDTSLSASTTYDYFVQAFDYSFNYSSSSNVLSTTTPGFPAPPARDSSFSQGTVARIVVRNFEIETGLSTSSISLETPRPTRLNVRWGKTASYELGYIVNNALSQEHDIFLTDLEPGTTYEYEVIAETSFGLESVVRSGQFVTKEVAVPNVPTNVARFLALASGDNVQLSWQAPQDEDVAFVRIVRSHLNFPEHSQDGSIAYQGSRTEFVDQGILNQYSPVYYTAFTFDSEGNVSSGAIALVYRESMNEGGEFVAIEQNGGFEFGGGSPVEAATSTVERERMTVDMKVPELFELTFTQGENEFTFLDSDITLDPDLPFTISIPADSVAGNLKTIIGTLLDPTDNRQSYSFLLRINKDQTAYEASVASLSVFGRSQMTVEIFDYEAAVIATYQTPISFIDVPEPRGATVEGATTLERSFWVLPAALLGLALCLILLVVLRRRRS